MFAVIDWPEEGRLLLRSARRPPQPFQGSPGIARYLPKSRRLLLSAKQKPPSLRSPRSRIELNGHRKALVEASSSGRHIRSSSMHPSLLQGSTSFRSSGDWRSGPSHLSGEHRLNTVKRHSEVQNETG